MVFPKTIRNHHAIISSALHQAVRWGWVKQNVAIKAKPPRVSQRRVTAPSVDAVRSVIEAAEERDPRLAPLLMLAALTGLRRGELCALRWTDVDLDRGELTSRNPSSSSLTDLPKKQRRQTVPGRRSRRSRSCPARIPSGKDRRVGAESRGCRTAQCVRFSPAVDGSKPFRPDNVTGFFTRVRDSLGPSFRFAP